jgi:threonine-phosphate decarboxylase
MIERIRKSFARSRSCHHGGKVRQAASLLGAEPLDFSANINPLGPPDLTEVVLRELKSIGHYPDNTYADFKQAAADFLGIYPQSIVPGNGSSEIIRLFAETVLEEGETVLIPQPTFGEYETQSVLAGGSVRKVPLCPDGLPELTDEDLSGAKALFLCNPNNPTGWLLTRDQVLEIADRCEENEIFILVDEAFIELSDPERSLAQIAPDREYLLVMRSLTKSFAVPGLRLGFGVTNSLLAEVMNRARIPWSISSIASAAGVYLLKHPDYLSKSREIISSERAWLSEALEGLGFRPYPSAVNFILADIGPSGISSLELARRAMSEGVLIRDCTSFGLKNHIRVAVRMREENERLIGALKAALC